MYPLSNKSRHDYNLWTYDTKPPLPSFPTVHNDDDDDDDDNDDDSTIVTVFRTTEHLSMTSTSPSYRS